MTKTKADTFVKKCRKALHKDIRIQVTERQPRNEFAWFDIISNDNANGALNRFSYINKSTSDILPGIIHFLTMMEHITSNSTKKKYYNKDKQ